MLKTFKVHYNLRGFNFARVNLPQNIQGFKVDKKKKKKM